MHNPPNALDSSNDKDGERQNAHVWSPKITSSPRRSGSTASGDEIAVLTTHELKASSLSCRRTSRLLVRDGPPGGLIYGRPGLSGNPPCVDLREPPRHRADAATEAHVASMAYDTQNLISTQAQALHLKQRSH